MLIPYRAFLFKKSDTFLHRLDPRVKFLVALTFAVLSLLFEKLLPLIVLFACLIPLALAGKIFGEWLSALKGLSLFAVLIFAVNFTLIFLGSGKPLDFPVAMTLRFLVLVSAFSIFFLVTSPDEFGLALQQSRVPFDLVFALTMAIRFVPVLALELQAISDAQRSKGLELDKGNFFARLKNRLPLLIPLIIGSVKRSIEIAEAMEARGYGAEARRTSMYCLKFKCSDAIVVTLILALILLAIYVKIYMIIPNLFP